MTELHLSEVNQPLTITHQRIDGEGNTVGLVTETDLCGDDSETVRFDVVDGHLEVVDQFD